MSAAGCRSDFQTTPAQQMPPSSSAETAEQSELHVYFIITTVQFPTPEKEACYTITKHCQFSLRIFHRLHQLEQSSFNGRHDILSVQNDIWSAQKHRIVFKILNILKR